MSRITNEHGFSESWVAACQAALDGYEKVGYKSTTTLIDSCRVGLLKERHADDIVQDVSSLMFAMMGTAIHWVLENSGDNNAITEQRITTNVLGKEVSMMADRIEPTGNNEWHLKDYKICRVWAYRMGAKYTETAQANWYRVGYAKEMGLNITRMSHERLFRDWTMTDSLRDPQYPKHEVAVMPVKMLPDEDVWAHIRDRVELFVKNEHVPDGQLPFCTESERWASQEKWIFRKCGSTRTIRAKDTEEEAMELLRNCKPKKVEYEIELVKGKTEKGDRWKVRKKGLKTTCKSTKSEQEAKDWIEQKTEEDLEKNRDNHEVVRRPGMSKRCELYCPVKKWCNQYHMYINPAF